MGTSAAIMAGGAIVGSYMSGEASKDAADTMAQANRESAALSKSTADRQMDIQQKQYDEGVARQKPWLDAGQQALSELSSGLRQGGEFNTPFSFSTTGPNADPSYAWRVEQGRRAMDAAAAAHGGMFTGGQQLALQNYGQQQGAQEYQAQFDRWRNSQLQRYNMVAGVAGTGQAAANNMNASGQSFANNQSTVLGNLANTQIGLNSSTANAQAASQVAQANAFNNLLGQGIGLYTAYQTGGGSMAGRGGTTGYNPSLNASIGQYQPADLSLTGGNSTAGLFGK